MARLKMIQITPTIALNPDDIELSYVRASGPGGQNVNKVATAVQLRFDIRGAASLPVALRVRAEKLAGRRLTKDGVIVITANRFRTQDLNRKDAIDRLVELLAAAAKVRATRRPTRPSRTQKKKRLDSKTRRGAIKRLRGKGTSDDQS